MALGPEQTPLTFDEDPIKGTGLRVLCNFFNHHETFLLISHGITHGSCWIKFCNCGSKISDLNIVNLIIYSICIFGDSNNSQWTFINHCLWNKIGSKLQFLHYPFTLQINLFFSSIKYQKLIMKCALSCQTSTPKPAGIQFTALLKRKNSTTPSNLKRGTVVKWLKIVLLHAIKRYDIIWDSILSWSFIAFWFSSLQRQ